MTRDDYNISTAPDKNRTVKGMHNFSNKVIQSQVATVNNSYRIKFDEIRGKKTKLTVTEFYKTYDPTIGIHIAAVLGGILIMLILYLVYRINCRKCIVSFVKRDKNKNKKEQEKVKMVMEIEETKRFSLTENGANIGMAENVICDQCLDDCSRQESYCDYCKLPDIETDMVQATAQWVTQHPVELVDPSGIILKINPKFLLKDGSIKDQWCSETHPTTSSGKVTNLLKYKWNQSLPVLNRYTEVPKPKRIKKCQIYQNQNQKYNVIPMQAGNKDHNPSSNDMEENSGKKQPIDLTPIIKIQNYDGQKLKKSGHCSKDTCSSNSSDDYSLQKCTVSWKDKSDINNIPGRIDEQEMVQCINAKQLLYQNNIQMHIKSSETKL